MESRTIVIGCWVALLLAAGAGPAAGTPGLESWLGERVRTLERPVHLYHYTTRARLGLEDGYIAPRDPRLTPYLQGKVERFWSPDAPISAGATVGGLYAATDPVAGRAFGGAGDGWALVEMVLEQGFRYLDVRDGSWSGARQRDRALPVVLTRELEGLGCEAAYPAELLLMLESRSCRQIALQVLRALGVDGLLYSFHRFDYPACGGRDEGAFVILRDDRLRLDASRLFTSVLPAADDAAAAERQRIQTLFARARQAGSTRALPWTSLEPLPAAGPFVDWMRSSLFGCGPEHPAAAQLAASRPQPAAPADAEAALEEARALVAAGDLRRAIDAYEGILEQQPDHVPALDELGWLLATASDAALRDPTRAMELGDEVVRITHYRDRRAWSKARKVRSAHTLAVAHAAAGSFERALDYARWSAEVAGRLHEVEGAGWSAALLQLSEELTALFEAGRPFEPADAFRRAEVQ